MKFQNLAAFEKHLTQGLVPLYLLAASCPYERKKMAEIIFSAFKQEIDVQCREGGNIAIDEMVAELNSFPLFGKTKVFYLDSVEKLKKNGMESLCSYVANPSPFSYLILGASSVKPLNEFLKKGAILCDLTQEKPWDRKERLKKMGLQEAKKMGKEISVEALDYLLDRAGLDLPGVEQEILKLSIYLGERARIDLKDVKTLCFQEKEEVLWQIAEALIWKEGLPSSSIDLSDLLPLISLLRTQLQQGLQVAILLKQGFGSLEISQYIPTLRSYTLEKLIPQVKAKGIRYFQGGLEKLFEMELLAKNGVEPGILLDLFKAKL